jgi:hypothetical protein
MSALQRVSLAATGAAQASLMHDSDFEDDFQPALSRQHAQEPPQPQQQQWEASAEPMEVEDGDQRQAEGKKKKGAWHYGARCFPLCYGLFCCIQEGRRERNRCMRGSSLQRTGCLTSSVYEMEGGGIRIHRRCKVAGALVGSPCIRLA